MVFLFSIFWRDSFVRDESCLSSSHQSNGHHVEQSFSLIKCSVAWRLDRLDPSFIQRVYSNCKSLALSSWQDMTSKDVLKKSPKVWHRAFLMNKGLAFCVCNLSPKHGEQVKSTVTSSRSCDVAELFAPRNSPASRLVAEFYFAKPWLGARWVPWLQGFTQVWTNSQAGFCTAHFIFSFVKLQKSCVAIIVILCVVLKFIDAMLLFLKKAGCFSDSVYRLIVFEVKPILMSPNRKCLT